MTTIKITMNIKTLIMSPWILCNSQRITVLFWIVAFSINFTSPVYAVDFSAPLIELPKLEVPKSDDTPIYIEVIVEDDNGVDTVQLYYRPVNSSAKFALTKMKLIKVGKNKYFVELPTSVFKMKGLDYYVEARDKANNVSQEPFPKQPRKVFFTGMKGNSRNKTSNIALSSNWGASVSYGSYTVDDPDGPTGSAATPSFSLYHRWLISRRTSAWLSLSYHNFILPYSRTQIGQEVQSIYLDAIYRWGFTNSRNRAWIGGGLGVGANKIKDRWTSNGVFRETDFGNRSQTDYGIILDTGYELRLAEGNWIGIRAMLYDSNNSGVSRRAVGVYIDIN